MWEKLFFKLGAKAGSVGKNAIHTPVPHMSVADQIKDLAYDELVSKEYIHKLISRAKNPEQLGRILHYLDNNYTGNLSNYEWSELRSFVMDRFKEIKINELLSHTLDLILMHIF